MPLAMNARIKTFSKQVSAFKREIRLSLVLRRHGHIATYSMTPHAFKTNIEIRILQEKRRIVIIRPSIDLPAT